MVFPIWIFFLFLSNVASCILQHCGNHYTFVKFLVKRGSIDTDNFVNAFVALWKSKEMNDTNVKEELRQLMKEKVKTSKKTTVDTIFEIINQAQGTDHHNESEKNLRENLLLLRSSPTQGTFWQKPVLHRLVENNQLFWFGFLTFFGGECGAKSGQEDSSINLLKDKLARAQDRAQDPAQGLVQDQDQGQGQGQGQERDRDRDRYRGRDRDRDRGRDRDQVQDQDQDQVQEQDQDQGKDKVQDKAESLLKTQFFFVRYWIERLMLKYAEFAIHIAAAKANLQEIEMLIANSFDVNKENEEGNTPLHCAFDKLPSVDTLRILIANGAKINAQNKDGKTPLHLAFEKRDLECFKYLLNNGADVKVKDNRGRTPLHYASEENQLEFVKTLVESDASGLLEEDNQGMTALHLAAEKGHKDCLKYLTEKTEDVSFQDDHGWDLLTMFANYFAK